MPPGRPVRRRPRGHRAATGVPGTPGPYPSVSTPRTSSPSPRARLFARLMKIISSENTVGTVTRAFSADQVPAAAPTSAPTATDAVTSERRHSGTRPRAGDQTPDESVNHGERRKGDHQVEKRHVRQAAIERREQSVAGGERQRCRPPVPSADPAATGRTDRPTTPMDSSRTCCLPPGSRRRSPRLAVPMCLGSVAIHCARRRPDAGRSPDGARRVVSHLVPLRAYEPNPLPCPVRCGCGSVTSRPDRPVSVSTSAAGNGSATGSGQPHDAHAVDIR